MRRLRPVAGCEQPAGGILGSGAAVEAGGEGKIGKGRGGSQKRDKGIARAVADESRLAGGQKREGLSLPPLPNMRSVLQPPPWTMAVRPALLSW